MNLRANPLATFEGSDAPLALYARIKWMNAGAAERAASRLVDRICKSQGADGSWQHSIARTIESLFALWLLDKPSATTTKGLDWLLETHRPPLRLTTGNGRSYDNFFFAVRRADVSTVSDTPFTQGCSGFVKTGAALFLACALRQGDSQRVSAAFKTLAALSRNYDGRLCSGPCGNNVFQAIAIHPSLARSEAGKKAAGWLAANQTPRGTWGAGIPFFPSIYALSRMPAKAAGPQVGRAVDRLVKLQNKDGSWGRSNQILNTFLAVDALGRLGVTCA